MKFLVSKDIHANPNFVMLIAFYSLMLLIYFIGDLVYLVHFFGSSIDEVLFTLKGNADEFIEPLSLLSLLEHVHISLFLSITALFTTLALILRLKLTDRHKQLIILLSMGTLLLSALCLLGTYFWLDILVYGFVMMTLGWHGMGIYALILCFVQIGMKKT